MVNVKSRKNSASKQLCPQTANPIILVQTILQTFCRVELPSKKIISFIFVRMDKGLIWQRNPSFVKKDLRFGNILSTV